MPTSRDLEDLEDLEPWQLVHCRADFATYLRFLARDGERARSDPEPDEHTARRLPHTSIDGFLWGWFRLLGSGLDGTDSVYETAGPLGWRELAHQLDAVRTTPPGFDHESADRGFGPDGDARAAPGSHVDIEPEQVDTARDLRRYIAVLATDFARDRREHPVSTDPGEAAGADGGWAHGTLSDWLEAWSAWIGDTSPSHGHVDPVTWRSVARQLSAARVYE
ncbi:hypothetical protein [Streptomyces sp. SID3343]|uniref:hypothetical protein n=1 Tax=Streptomyces sp. SID3343 TaxID=2690260 RepID=UPI001371A2FA|nr:hypothetical protein [Streptomyces sp. SID3343]MYW04529.1 hypothetical protein [Streptomyces sp. SID3343]